MKILIGILAVLFILGLLYAMIRIIIALHEETCKQCPHHKKCEAHADDKEYIPQCTKDYFTHINQNPFQL